MMQATGATLVKHYRDLAFMGFAEVVKNLPTILNNLSFRKPDSISVSRIRYKTKQLPNQTLKSRVRGEIFQIPQFLRKRA